jgi:hypothetical protein
VSTLLSLAVVLVAIVGVLRIALKDPDQPATMRRPTRSRSPGRAPRAAMSPRPAEVRAITVPERAVAGTRRPPPSRLRSAGRRLRSGIALMLLVAVVGVMLALAVGAVLVGGALALRSAVS